MRCLVFLHVLSGNPSICSTTSNREPNDQLFDRKNDVAYAPLLLKLKPFIVGAMEVVLPSVIACLAVNML